MSAVDVALVVVRLAIGCWLLWSLPTVARRSAGAGVDLGAASVVIPARNEADVLPALLASLPPGPEVVVVDDGSTDATAAVAAAAGARVVAAGPTPEGWLPKSWACHRGAAATGGDRLVFVDADVRFAEGGLEALLAHPDLDVGLVSVQPHHLPERPAEHLALLFNVVSIAGTDAASPLGRRRGPRGAFGPVLGTGREALVAVGGHAAVRGDIVEDVALARRYRQTGRPVHVLGGGTLVGFRMYPEGLGQLVEGFTKNLAAGAGAIRRATALLVLAWATLLVQAGVAPFRALAQGAPAATLGAAAALYVAVAVQLWWMGRKVGRFGGWVAAAFPVSVVLFLVVFVRSTWARVTGRVRWRGRDLRT